MRLNNLSPLAAHSATKQSRAVESLHGTGLLRFARDDSIGSRTERRWTGGRRMRGISRLVALALLALALAGAGPAAAQKKYGPGASDTEITIGNTAPYSGPASAYGAAATSELAYFQMLNEQGGVNGRRITMISLDDGYSPPKAVEQVRRLVENDNVLFIFNPVGTPSNSAIHKYLNQK
jgi:ABC-type branched-subunit amino acid transport system substrate-binding protein